MTERRFTFLGHEIVVDELYEDPYSRVTGPCSVPLTIANAFDFMIENGCNNLVVDGVEIRRTR